MRRIPVAVSSLGMNPSQAIVLFYKQIKLCSCHLHNTSKIVTTL